MKESFKIRKTKRGDRDSSQEKLDKLVMTWAEKENQSKRSNRLR